MKTRNLFLAMCAGLAITANAQLSRFNTGADPGTNYSSYVPYGGIGDWRVAQTTWLSQSTPPPIGPLYLPAVSVNAVSGWYDPHNPLTIPNAAWITFPNTCSSDPSYHGCLNDPIYTWGVDQWYLLEFELNCCEENFCLNWSMWADNRIAEIYVNTMVPGGTGHWVNQLPGDPGTYQGYYKTNRLTKMLCENWQPGYNYVIVHVTSYDPANNSDHAGLLIKTTDQICSQTDPWVNDDTGGEDDPTKPEAPGTSGARLNSDKVQRGNAIMFLGQNVPNPFGESTTIPYSVPANAGSASLIFSNDRGDEVRRIELKQKGKGSIIVPGNEFGNGFYSYRLEIDGGTIESKKMIKE